MMISRTQDSAQAYRNGLAAGFLPNGVCQLLDVQGRLASSVSKETQAIYAQATSLMNDKKYAQAGILFDALGVYADAAKQGSIARRNSTSVYRVENLPGSNGFICKNGVYYASLGDNDSYSLCKVVFVSRTGQIIVEHSIDPDAIVTALDTAGFEGADAVHCDGRMAIVWDVPDEEEHFLYVRRPANNDSSFGIRIRFE